MTAMNQPTTRQTGGKKKPLVEELISMEAGNGTTVHAYVIMLPEEQATLAERVRCLVVETAEKMAKETGGFFLPIALETRLGDGGGEVVRKLLCQNKDVAASVDKVFSGKKDFHMTIIVIMTGSPENEMLWQLH